MNFDEAVARVLNFEGGFSEDPNDRGNWSTGRIGEGQLKGTKYGISAMAYPDLDIRNLTVADAIRIYKRDYWDKLRLDEMPPQIRLALFDLGVNSGIQFAARTLQTAVGVTADGVIGPVTMAAVQRANPTSLLSRICGIRLRLMTDMPGWRHFGAGWVRRVAKVLEAA